MPAGLYNATVDRGETWQPVFTFEDANGVVDLTGYTAKIEVRDGPPDAPGDVVYTFSTSPGAGQGTIELGDDAGTITPTLTPADSLNFTAESLYCWDLFLTAPDSSVIRLLYGAFRVRERITQL